MMQYTITNQKIREEQFLCYLWTNNDLYCITFDVPIRTYTTSFLIWICTMKLLYVEAV